LRWRQGAICSTARYGANTALDGINLGIESGKVTALLGPNGAGKSTAISLLLGLSPPDDGRVGLLLLTSSYYPQARPLEALAGLAGIGELLNRPYGKLSGGQQHRSPRALGQSESVPYLMQSQ
jgi:ABC-2 type transport system ATP-binding protein